METKRCRRCLKLLPSSRFNKDSAKRDGLRSYCKPCQSADAMEWNAKHKTKARIWQREWARRNRDKRNASYYRWWNRLTPRQRVVVKLRTRIKTTYGITYEEYLAKRKAQKNRCAICGCRPRAARRLDLDHNQTTGNARGLLCNRCNSALERLERFADWEINARKYLAAWV